MKLTGLNNYRPLKIPPADNDLKKRSRRTGGYNWVHDPFSNPLDKISRSAKNKANHKKYYRKRNG